MPVTIGRFLWVMSAGFGVTDGMVESRHTKTKDFLAIAKKQLETLQELGYGSKPLKTRYDDAELARANAMRCKGNRAKRDALDPVKETARKLAKDAPKIAAAAADEGKQLTLKMRMAEAMCGNFKKIAENGLPKTGGEEEEEEAPPQDLTYLDKAVETTLPVILTTRVTIKENTSLATNTWNKDAKPYYDALTRYGKEVIEPVQSKRVQKLIEQFPNGAEARMQTAMGPEFTKSLIKVVQTAEAFGVSTEGLSPGELVAIFQYTTSDYKKMNPFLLGMLKPPATGKAKTDLETKCDISVSALKKLEAYEGISKRGEKDWPGADQLYVVDNTFTVKQFWSTGIGFNFSGKYQITVNGKTGRDVACFSNSPNESEILFAPGTTFKVISREDSVPGTVNIVVSEV